MVKQKMVALSAVGALLLSSGVVVLAEERLGNDLGQYSAVFESAIQGESLETTNNEETGSGAGWGEVGKDGLEVVEPITTETPIETTEQPKPVEPTTVEPVQPSEPVEPTLPTTTTEEKTVVEEPKPVEPATTKEDVEPAITNPVEKPVVISSGTIIGTQDGNVLLQNQDGTVQTLAASSVGGTLESDGTIKIKDSEGKITRLPNTGQHSVSSVALTLTGILTLFGTVYLKYKELLG